MWLSPFVQFMRPLLSVFWCGQFFMFFAFTMLGVGCVVGAVGVSVLVRLRLGIVSSFGILFLLDYIVVRSFCRICTGKVLLEVAESFFFGLFRLCSARSLRWGLHGLPK
jgi:hypothetical protein